MPGSAYRPFEMPTSVPSDQQVAYCIGIIDRYRKELPMLRMSASKLKEKTKSLEQEVEYWKKKYQEEKEKRETVEKELEKVLKTKDRYQVALFDHGNFTHPNTKDKKLKGGQKGHANTNRESHEDYALWLRKRVFAKKCGTCGRKLSRVRATRQKMLVDIVMKPEVVKLIVASERQWCGTCRHEVAAQDNRSLPFTEYGINTFMMVMLLRFRAHASMRTIASVLAVSNGLTLANSDVANIVKAAGNYLGKQYKALKKAVRAGEIMYADETGWLIHGQKAWMWIMSNEQTTVYVAAESRGKGIAEELYGNSSAFAMTDGLRSYQNVIPKEKHLYCWSHVLRFSFEETIHSKKDSQAVLLREALVRIYHIKKNHPAYTPQELENVVRDELDQLLTVESKEEACNKIQRRVEEQKEGLIRALLITTDGTNNLAERELRNMAIKRTISHGSDTYKGMETTAIIGSVLQTIHRDKGAPFLPTLQQYMLKGIRDKHKQYLHTSYCDS